MTAADRARVRAFMAGAQGRATAVPPTRAEVQAEVDALLALPEVERQAVLADLLPGYAEPR